MANHKSSLKRIKQSLVKRERNRTAKSAMRTIIKRFNATVATDVEGAKAVMVEAVPAIAKMGSKGIIHKNNASRKISRLAKKLHKASTAGQGA